MSKQPLFKSAVARVTRLESGDGAPAAAPTTTGSRPVAARVPDTAGGADALADERVTAAAPVRRAGPAGGGGR
ncbi:hypothetical protein ABNF97_01530 [Plantactinospora sp. B6F1]|uniref:hypothetical protein n=1 Tax=Plantactinospora sp. B6F1 TaxID=3158971 RepID=UPI0032D97B88